MIVKYSPLQKNEIYFIKVNYNELFKLRFPVFSERLYRFIKSVCDEYFS